MRIEVNKETVDAEYNEVFVKFYFMIHPSNKVKVRATEKYILAEYGPKVLRQAKAIYKNKWEGQ
jgi:hypothetical protein